MSTMELPPGEFDEEVMPKMSLEGYGSLWDVAGETTIIKLFNTVLSKCDFLGFWFFF